MSSFRRILLWQRPIVQRIVVAAVERRWQRQQQQHLERPEDGRQEPEHRRSALADRPQHAPRPAHHLAVDIRRRHRYGLRRRGIASNGEETSE